MEVHVHVGRLRLPPRLPAHDGREVRPHDVGFAEQRLRQVEAEDGGRVVFEHVDRPVRDLQRRARLLHDGHQGLECLLARGLGLEVELEARSRGGLFYRLLVLVVADLDKGHETREVALLCRLPLDVEPLANSIAAEHPGDGIAARGPIDDKPLGLAVLGRVRGELVELDAAGRPTSISAVVEICDELARVRQVLLGMQLADGAEEPLEGAPRQREHGAGGLRRDVCHPRRVLDQRELPEELAAVVDGVGLHVVLAHPLPDPGLALLQDVELLALFVLRDDVRAGFVCAHLEHVREFGNLLGLHHLQELGALEVVLPHLALVEPVAHGEVHEVLAPEFAGDAVLAREERVAAGHAVEDLALVDDRAPILGVDEAVALVAADAALQDHQEPVAGLPLLAEGLAGVALVDLHGLDKAHVILIAECPEGAA
mmetsp:Transcript_62740/g.178182  ORF Transcript_62740/g.178182 Transcript_62740/m.178182 type:complete len:428 (+) Transcript_62740:818-2101(+)